MSMRFTSIGRGVDSVVNKVDKVKKDPKINKNLPLIAWYELWKSNETK